MTTTYYDINSAILDSSPRMTPYELVEENARLTEENARLKAELDAYKKVFQITTYKDQLDNHAVFKVDYDEVINSNDIEIAEAIAYRLADIIKNARDD